MGCLVVRRIWVVGGYGKRRRIKLIAGIGELNGHDVLLSGLATIGPRDGGGRSFAGFGIGPRLILSHPIAWRHLKDDLATRLKSSTIEASAPSFRQ